jgi:transcriptional regulator with XRE-family HTH domain
MATTINEAEVRTRLGRNLKRLRAAKNLSQLSLALRAGVTHSFINDIENGKKWLSPKTLASLATVLETRPQEFFAPETVLSGQETAALTRHLDSFAEDVLRWVGAVKERCLQSAGSPVEP